MPRHPRLFVPGAIYHVYCRIARGEFVFEDDHEAIEFIEALRRVRDLDEGEDSEFKRRLDQLDAAISRPR
jgi:hypothetical protein